MQSTNMIEMLIYFFIDTIGLKVITDLLFVMKIYLYI